MNISIIILTLNGIQYINKILDKIDFNKYQTLIIDSNSNDGTIEICKQFNCEIKILSEGDFNHGATREMGRAHTNSDIVVFITQDAILDSELTVEKLIAPILEGEADVAYARQIPRPNAGIIESFQREFNYGTNGQIRSISDVNKYGVYTFFCSNSCSAWSNKALDEIGGFKPTLTNEDYFACSELLIKGYKVAYVPESVVIHSHKYSLREEFQRMFDTGYVRAERSWVQEAVGSVDKRGANYFINLINKLWTEKPHLIPYAFIQTAVKYFGYKLGYYSLKFPKWFKKACSGQKYYWNSKYYIG